MAQAHSNAWHVDHNSSTPYPPKQKVLKLKNQQENEKLTKKPILKAYKVDEIYSKQFTRKKQPSQNHLGPKKQATLKKGSTPTRE